MFVYKITLKCDVRRTQKNITLVFFSTIFFLIFVIKFIIIHYSKFIHIIHYIKFIDLQT